MRYGKSLAKAVCAIAGVAALSLSAEGFGYEFVADSTFYYKTDRQSVVPSKFGFNDPVELKKLPLSFGQWEGVDLTPSRPVVKPDFMLERSYQSSVGDSVWFQLIRGRIERAVHVPAICYYNAGWQIMEQAADNVQVGDHSIPCGRMVLRKGDLCATEFYFYLWGDPGRDFMKGCVMFRVASIGRGGQNGRVESVKKFIRDLFSALEKTS